MRYIFYQNNVKSRKNTKKIAVPPRSGKQIIRIHKMIYVKRNGEYIHVRHIMNTSENDEKDTF